MLAAEAASYSPLSILTFFSSNAIFNTHVVAQNRCHVTQPPLQLSMVLWRRSGHREVIQNVREQLLGTLQESWPTHALCLSFSSLHPSCCLGTDATVDHEYEVTLHRKKPSDLFSKDFLEQSHITSPTQSYSTLSHERNPCMFLELFWVSIIWDFSVACIQTSSYRMQFGMKQTAKSPSDGTERARRYRRIQEKALNLPGTIKNFEQMPIKVGVTI